MDIKTVTVIGANGTMGYNACAMFASFGNAKVYMISRDLQKSRVAIDKAIKAVRADSIRANLVACDYSALKECVEDSDLVFESVAENMEIKKQVTAQIGEWAGPDTVIASGTSGLSINGIASVLPAHLRKNYYGMHFFNPPYSMPLLELIPSDGADSALTEEIKRYLEDVILRTVVVCKDSPAFIANRIGFQFMNLCLQYAEKYKEEGGIDYIDSIMGPFTGRAMTPCATVDFVGLDVHKAIVDNVKENTNDYLNATFEFPAYVQELIDKGKLGRKTNSGLFKTEITEEGKKIKYVYDIKSGRKTEIRKYDIPFAGRMNALLKNGEYLAAFEALRLDESKEALICKELLRDYVDYSLFVVNEVCDSIGYVDDAMATGFNWCPPLAMSNVLFGTDYETKYDFRSFFKAVR